MPRSAHVQQAPFVGSGEFRYGPCGLLLDYMHFQLKMGANTPGILFSGATAGLTQDTGTAMFLYRPLVQPDQYVTVTFESAEGLQAGQSQLKYKDIVFDTIKSLRLSPDLNHVVVTIATTHEAEPLLTDGAVFWLVKPRFFAGNISGLETLVSKSFISMLPPETTGKARREFAGQEDPPILAAHVPGHTFPLTSRQIGSITVGSPSTRSGLGRPYSA